jgi:hypothetical protein
VAEPDVFKTPVTLPVTYAKLDEPPPPPFTVRVKVWLAGVPTPLPAAMVRE